MTNVTESFDVLDVDSLMEHVGSDTSLLTELVDIFRDYYPEQLASIRSAVELGDNSAIRETAHQFKGAVSNFHATAAVEAAHEIEFAGREERLDDAKNSLARLEQEVERMNNELSALCSQ